MSANDACVRASKRSSEVVRLPPLAFLCFVEWNLDAWGVTAAAATQQAGRGTYCCSNGSTVFVTEFISSQATCGTDLYQFGSSVWSPSILPNHSRYGGEAQSVVPFQQISSALLVVQISRQSSDFRLFAVLADCTVHRVVSLVSYGI